MLGTIMGCGPLLVDGGGREYKKPGRHQEGTSKIIENKYMVVVIFFLVPTLLLLFL
jgi:hypothetical protein